MAKVNIKCLLCPTNSLNFVINFPKIKNTEFNLRILNRQIVGGVGVGGGVGVFVLFVCFFKIKTFICLLIYQHCCQSLF